MDEWAVALILIGVSVVVAAALVGMCRLLGGWTYLFAFVTGDKEERTQLASHEENGYITYPPPNYYPHSQNSRPQFIPQQSFSDSLKSVDVVVPPIPPPPDQPTNRRFSLDIARRASIDTDLPDILFEGGSNAKLQRAMSCDSVCSDTSVVMDTMESPQNNGELEVAIEYSSKTEELIVMIIRARNLMAFDSTIAKVDSYIRVSLHPDESSIMQTALHRDNKDPEYNERFVFSAPRFSLRDRVLKCTAYTCDKSTNTVLGQSDLKLASVNLKEPHKSWLPLTDSKRRPVGCGELLFSLSYLPTAERLTVVLVKARNLVWAEGKESADPFVKIYLLQKGKKISKKKTSVKRGDRNPVFNEAMIFSVPAAALQNIQLRLTVAEYQAEGKTPSVGHIFVGPSCSGKALSHWNQMISAPRKPIAMWHPLKKREG
ncbi:hypothetical protein JTE90_019886 [Oedothorax gibbosus]|uniref:C2 domain-containing protein n=1 Tax=Oedothorax gibbosus TaxID=931172 RepID=A0AAV6VYY1_9ARAC|nr:hypothetical protein JTE90_019886 [Oedothorax gibbosus]